MSSKDDEPIRIIENGLGDIPGVKAAWNGQKFILTVKRDRWKQLKRAILHVLIGWQRRSP